MSVLDHQKVAPRGSGRRPRRDEPAPATPVPARREGAPASNEDALSARTLRGGEVPEPTIGAGSGGGPRARRFASPMFDSAAAATRRSSESGTREPMADPRGPRGPVADDGDDGGPASQTGRFTAMGGAFGSAAVPVAGGGGPEPRVAPRPIGIGRGPSPWAGGPSAAPREPSASGSGVARYAAGATRYAMPALRSTGRVAGLAAGAFGGSVVTGAGVAGRAALSLPGAVAEVLGTAGIAVGAFLGAALGGLVLASRAAGIAAATGWRVLSVVPTLLTEGWAAAREALRPVSERVDLARLHTRVVLDNEIDALRGGSPDMAEMRDSAVRTLKMSGQAASVALRALKPPPVRVAWPTPRRALVCVGLGVTLSVAGWAGAWGVVRATEFSRRTSALSVRVITVDGLTRLGETEVLAAAGIRPQDNLIELDLDQAKARLGALPWVKEAVVHRRLPDRVAIRIEEREPALLLAAGGDLWLVDADGTPFHRLGPGESHDLPVVTGVDPAAGIAGAEEAGSLARERLQAAVRLVEAFQGRRRLSPADVGEIRVAPDGRMAVYTAREGTVVHLGRDALASRVARLDALLDGSWMSLQAVEAVDLDLEDKVVVRPRGRRREG